MCGTENRQRNATRHTFDDTDDDAVDSIPCYLCLLLVAAMYHTLVLAHKRARDATPEYAQHSTPNPAHGTWSVGVLCMRCVSSRNH